MTKIESHVPQGPITEKWSKHKADIKVVSPANKRKLDIIVVGTGLGGASAAASLGELGYNVKIFCISDSPRRAHSIAAQGGINAAKNYQNDNDSVFRLFYDTIKGGDNMSNPALVREMVYASPVYFDLLLDKTHVVGTPGSGFGPSGEGFFRLTAFGNADKTVEAVERIKAYFAQNK